MKQTPTPSSNRPCPDESLAARVQKLEDLNALTALQMRYTKAVDAKYTATRQRQKPDLFERAVHEQAACFTDDGIWDVGINGVVAKGQQQLQEAFRYVPWKYAFHSYISPDLVINGDSAEGSWALWEIVITQKTEETLLIFGNSYERFQRTAAGWRISYMRFDLLNSITLSTQSDAIRSLISTQNQIQKLGLS